MHPLKTSLTIFMMVVMNAATASVLNHAQSIQNETNTASAASQGRINDSADATLVMRSEIERLRLQVENLEVYQSHLKGLVASQQQEMSSIERQIEEIKNTRQGMVPLMYQMIEGLKVIVANDVPVKKLQRETRIAKLEKLMPRADVSDAEKYRRILEAYLIEMEYGTKMGIYRGKIELEGEVREADILHLGRLTMIARSLNGQLFWLWDNHKKQWLAADLSFSAGFEQAFAVASKQIAPSLVTLPISPATGAVHQTEVK